MNSTSSAHNHKIASLLDGLADVIVKDAGLLETATAKLLAENKTLPEWQQACRAMIRCALMMQETLAIMKK